MRAANLPSRQGLLRLARRAMAEVIFVVAGLAICARQLSAGEPKKALVALAAGLVGALLGFLFLERSGALALALRCPRLDALGFPALAADVPWAALEAAEQELRALEESHARTESKPPVVAAPQPEPV